MKALTKEDVECSESFDYDEDADKGLYIETEDLR